MSIGIFGRTGNTNRNAQPRNQIIDLSQFLYRDGSTAIAGAYDMDNPIINLSDPVNAQDVANIRYVDLEIEHLKRELEQNLDRIITERVNEAVADAIENIENSTTNLLVERL